MKEIVVKIQTQSVVLTVGDGGGEIRSGLEREVCPSCNFPNCAFCCDGSKGADREELGEAAEDEQDVAERLQYNGALDLLESLLLAHAIAGIDVSDPSYVGGIKTALEAVGNNL